MIGYMTNKIIFLFFVSLYFFSFFQTDAFIKRKKWSGKKHVASFYYSGVHVVEN